MLELQSKVASSLCPFPYSSAPLLSSSAFSSRILYTHAHAPIRRTFSGVLVLGHCPPPQVVRAVVTPGLDLPRRAKPIRTLHYLPAFPAYRGHVLLWTRRRRRLIMPVHIFHSGSAWMIHRLHSLPKCQQNSGSIKLAKLFFDQ